MKPQKLAPGQKVLDWEAEYDNYIALKRTQDLSQIDYAKIIDIDKSWVSTNFARIRRQRYELDVRNRLPKIMAEALRDVQAALKLNRAENGLEDVKKQAYALEAFAKVADRTGFSPQAVTVNVQQNTQHNVIMPPIFGASYADGAKQMLERLDDAKD
jgi:hypothetical protein